MTTYNYCIIRTLYTTAKIRICTLVFLPVNLLMHFFSSIYFFYIFLPFTIFHCLLQSLSTKSTTQTLPDIFPPLIKNHYFSFPFPPISIHFPTNLVRLLTNLVRLAMVRGPLMYALYIRGNECMHLFIFYRRFAAHGSRPPGAGRRRALLKAPGQWICGGIER